MMKPRIINTTDLGADPDDEQSLVRFFVSANEYDVEGLIVVTGCWKTEQKSTVMLDKIVDAYEKVYPNLIKHAEGFPTTESLRDITVLGQTGYGMADVGDGNDSPGSELIIKAVDKDDPRPVWVTFWGGGNTLAQAIWKVRATRTEAEFNNFLSKLRVYDVLGQDDAATWIAKTFPDLLFIRAKDLVYNWQPTEDWVHEHIMSHGELGKVYPEKEWTYEGDTPAFMYLLPNGLSDPEHVEWGSWGGRFDIAKAENVRGMKSEPLDNETDFDPYYMHSDAPEGGDSIRRWKQDIENDFEARMDWSIEDKYENANHQPIAILNGDSARTVLNMNATAGTIIELSAKGSSDPDDDELSYTWSHYIEPSSYKDKVTIVNDATVSTTIQIPEDASWKDIHIILKVSDNGTPSLCAYRRMIISVQ